MSFDWADYLKLARALRQLADHEEAFAPISEASHRAAISRAYYAAFNLCRNYILENHADKTLLDANNPKVHGEVIRFFKDSNESDKVKIGKILGTLRDDRNSADYDNELSGFPAPMSKDAIEQAKKILDIIKKFS